MIFVLHVFLLGNYQTYLLCVKWLLTKSPELKAAINESSPAKTAPPMICASRLAFSAGFSTLGPVKNCMQK